MSCEIASRLRSSEAHLAKVLQRLAKAGLVRSEPGPRGGFVLAQPSGQVTLLEVFEAIEGTLGPGTCLFGAPRVQRQTLHHGRSPAQREHPGEGLPGRDNAGGPGGGCNGGCNGTECIRACADGALAVVDGKARLKSEALCDGLGACIGVCPRGALAPAGSALGVGPGVGAGEGQWPLKLRLISPGALFLRGADLLLLADCAAVAAADGVRRDVVRGRAVAMGCPKFDDIDAAVERLAAILTEARPRSLWVAVMEVPCCLGLAFAAREAARRAGAELAVSQVTISRTGPVRA